MADPADRAQVVIEQELAALLQRKTATTTPSRSQCKECDNDIPQARQQAIPGVQLCIACQEHNERHEKHYT